MPVTPDRLTRLRDFGLSEYAARAYLALLDLGIAEARDVSSISKVPQAKIYHVLEQLHEKGLVVILPEFPKKYAPVPFEDYLMRLHDEHRKAAASIESQRDELAELFRVKGDTDVGDRGFFTVIRGRRNVLSKVEEMVASAKRDILVLGTVGTTGRAHHFTKEFHRARARGVDVRMLVPMDDETLPRLEDLSEVASLRARELGDEEQSAKVAILVVDAAQAFIVHFVPDDGNLYTGKDIAVFTDQEAMVATVQAIVEPLWRRAPGLDAKRAEVLEGRAPEVTRVYTSVEDARAALQAALASDVKEVLALNAHPAGLAQPDAEHGDAVRARIRESGAKVRFVANVADVEALDALERRASLSPSTQVRHLRPRLLSRQIILDDREAFFALGGGDAGLLGEAGSPTIVLHTNNAAVVASMRAHFEQLWSTALSLEERRNELELFPDQQPAEFGLGRLFYQLSDAVVVADEAGRVLLWNPAAFEIFGYTPADAHKIRFAQLLQDAERSTFLENLRELHENQAGPLAAQRIQEAVCLRRDGGVFEAEMRFSTIQGAGGRPYLLAVVRDVTERNRARSAKLRDSHEIIRAYERMSDAFFSVDRAFRLVYTNPVTDRMRRSMPKESMMGKSLWTLFPDLKDTKFHEAYTRALRDGVPVHVEEYYPRMDRWFEAWAYPDEEGLSVFFRDVTERKRALADHERAQARLRGAFSDAPVPMAITDVEGRFVEVNAAFCALVGRSADELASLNLADVVHPDERDACFAALGGLLTGDGAPVRMEKTYVHKTGAEVRVRASLSVVRDAAGLPVEVLAHVVEHPDESRIPIERSSRSVRPA